MQMFISAPYSMIYEMSNILHRKWNGSNLTFIHFSIKGSYVVLLVIKKNT